MLKLVYGRSKSGKTTYMDNKICHLAQSGEDKLLFLVPDQITFETEKDLLKLLGPVVAQKVLVLGFSRLCDYVYEHTNILKRTPADDPTKAVLMSVALEEVRNELMLYSDKALSPELAKLMVSAKKELTSSGANMESVCENFSDTNSVMYKKLHDVRLASSAMEALLDIAFADPDAELSRVAKLVDEYKVFQDYTVFVDSYLVFSAPEYSVISAIMSQCRDMYCAFSYDGISKDGIFSASYKTISSLKEIAKSEGIKIDEPELCTYSGFFLGNDLSALEENVFSPAKETFSEPSENVTVYTAKNKYEEIDFVAREIRKLIIENNVMYKDIAVVGRDMSSYVDVIDTVFDKYKISYFADKPHDITTKPLVKLISSCFSCVTGGFDKDDILAILKTGLTSADDEDVYAFENYVYTWQLSFSSLLKEFTLNPRGFADEFTFDDLNELKKAENVRKLIITSLVSFKEKCEDATAQTICKNLYELLLELGTDKKLTQLCNRLSVWEEIDFSNEQIRLWEIFCATLDRTANIIGKRTVSIKRFCDLFMLQLSMTDISFIPKAIDQVTVGDIERLRLGGRKYVFVIGAVDGVFPKPPISAGYFTPAERNELGQLKVVNYTDDEENSLKELYLCYYALTSASDKLYVSYYTSELSGEVKYPSVIISEVTSILPECNMITRHTEDTTDLLWAAAPAYDLYALRARSTDEITSSLKEYFSKHIDFKDRLSVLDKTLNSKYRFNISDKKIAERLFGKNMYLSASRIDKYHMCRFAYFCRYGIKAKEKRKASVDAMEYGSFVHYILENFFKNYSKAEFVSLNVVEMENTVEHIMNDYANKHFGGLDNKSARFLFFYKETKESVVTLINHLIKELGQSDFTPVDFELNIGEDISAYKLKLNDDVSVTVTGQVDRADIMHRDGKAYIRIVDYKTGTKEFKLSDVIYGLNLQMLLYLSVIKSFGKDRYGEEIVPAGVLYMPSFVNTLNMAADTTAEEIEKSRAKELRMNGLLLNDEDVLASMEKGLSGVYIPVSAGSKGGYKGADNLATLEEFGAIFSYIDTLIADMATQLLNGNIDTTPANSFTSHACDWCPYACICVGKDSECQRNLYKLDRAEILKELGLSSDIKEGEQ